MASDSKLHLLRECVEFYNDERDRGQRGIGGAAGREERFLCTQADPFTPLQAFGVNRIETKRKISLLRSE
jgi:hypothetical protein